MFKIKRFVKKYCFNLIYFNFDFRLIYFFIELSIILFIINWFVKNYYFNLICFNFSFWLIKFFKKLTLFFIYLFKNFLHIQCKLKKITYDKIFLTIISFAFLFKWIVFLIIIFFNIETIFHIFFEFFSFFIVFKKIRKYFRIEKFVIFLLNFFENFKIQFFLFNCIHINRDCFYFFEKIAIVFKWIFDLYYDKMRYNDVRM